MKICQRCNVSCDDEFAFCKKCGSPLAVIIETAFCPYCGKKVDNGIEFCPYCGKHLFAKESYNKASLSNTNSQHSDFPQYNNAYVNANSSSSFSLGNIFSFIKNTPFIKWAIIVVIFVIDAITALFADVITHTYTMNIRRIGLGLQPKGNVSFDKVLMYLLGACIILSFSWFIVNKLHPKAAKVLWYLIFYVVITRLVFLFFGPIFGAIIFIGFMLWEYYSKKKTET